MHANRSESSEAEKWYYETKPFFTLVIQKLWKEDNSKMNSTTFDSLVEIVSVLGFEIVRKRKINNNEFEVNDLTTYLKRDFKVVRSSKEVHVCIRILTRFKLVKVKTKGTRGGKSLYEGQSNDLIQLLQEATRDLKQFSPSMIEESIENLALIMDPIKENENKGGKQND